MKKIILPLLVACMFCSCVTIFSPKHQTLRFSSRTPAKIVIDGDTIDIARGTFLNSNPTKVELPRSDQDKEAIVIRGNLVDTILLQAKFSLAYQLNVFTFGLGFLVDYNSPKKWNYADDVGQIRLNYDYIKRNSLSYVNARRARLASEEFKMRYSRKGVFNFRIGFPYINWFNLDYEGYGRKENIGFLGLSLGLDYFYRDNTFINLSGNGIMDFFVPFIAVVDYGGIDDHMEGMFLTLSNNHKIGKIAFGYGLSYGGDSWNTINHGLWRMDDDPELVNQPSIRRSCNSLGLVFPIHYYAVNSGFYYGLIYRPMLLQFGDKTRFKYQHTISFEFGWRI